MYATSITMRKRITWLLVGVTFVLLGLIVRLAYIQLVQGETLTRKALENRLRDVPVEAKRGTIYDRNGKELAISISADSVFAVPAQIKDPESTATQVAEILGFDKDKVMKAITKRSAFVWIARKIEPDKAQKLKKLDLKGIGFAEESKRYYTNDNLGARVLGFVQRIDNVGGGGIESSFNTELKGVPGKIVIEYDAAGREIPQATHQYIPPQDGNSLVLTIDETIQHFAERELDIVIEKYQADHASFIVMEAKTGRILAMANRPDYNPNSYGDFDSKTWRNFAVSDAYEPGSTFKVITAAAALEENEVRLDDQFYDPGYKEVLGKKVKCWKGGGHGQETFIEVVQNSCNPGFVELGLRLGVEKFFKYLKAFGFGKQTDIDLPGEATGILVSAKRATDLDLATMAIGQSNAVTPIQLVTAVAAVANDGKLMKPQLVQEIRDREGNMVDKFEPIQVRQVISKDTAKELSLILESVVAEGTGKNAYIEGYRVAGKTGTAQKAGPNGGYVAGRYVSSFVGFAPANDPEVVGLIVIDNPKGPVYYGGQIAAPVFSAVMGDVLKYLGIPPQLGPEVPKKKENFITQTEITEVTVPNLVNLPTDEAKKLVNQAGLKSKVEGVGNLVVNQFPLPGAVVNGGQEVIIYTGQNLGKGGKIYEATVPDLKGKSLRETAALLAATGLLLEPEGSGVAVEQSYPPGTKVKSGTKIKVKFEPPKASNQTNSSTSVESNGEDEDSS